MGAPKEHHRHSVIPVGNLRVQLGVVENMILVFFTHLIYFITVVYHIYNCFNIPFFLFFDYFPFCKTL